MCPKYILSPILALLAAFFLAGCMDMPITDIPPGEDPPIGAASVSFGPYLTSADGMQPMFRFISNRRCVAGIQVLDQRERRINRKGSFSLFHALSIPDLEASVLKRYQLWLDDRDGGIYRIRGLPRSGQATNIAFAGGDADPNRLAAAGSQLRRIDPDALVFVSPPFQGGVPDRPEEWATRFLNPLGNAIDFGPLWFAPGSGIPKELYPEHFDEGGYWRRDVGSLRIIGIDARAFSYESSRKNALARLEEDLDPGRRHRPWTVVVLSRAVFDARIADGRILEALGDRLEHGGVDLVIGGGAPYYLRTRPFSVANSGQTRYISMADNPVGPAVGLQPRDYVAVMSRAPHVARLWADEGTLEWQVLDLNGNAIDILTLNADRRPIENSMPKWDVLVDSQATLTLQKEVLRLTRQAAKATTNPRDQLLLPLYFANPSTKRFTGTLSWEVPPGSGWRIEPMTMPFDLQPGQGAVARFSVTPGQEDAFPTITATAVDVGSSRDSLVITQEKGYDVQALAGANRIDGRVRDKEYWNTFPALLGFTTVDGRPATNPVEGRIIADRRGLIVALSMIAKQPSAASPAASDRERDHDGPVMDDESIEIWLDPARRGREYFRFALNPRNVAFDESSRDGQSYNPQWQHTVRFGRAGGMETWNAEIRIPWEAFELAGPPQSGDVWGMQIVRRDYSAARDSARGRSRETPPPEISQWVQTYGSNTRPGLYGMLRFGDMSILPTTDEEEAAATPEQEEDRGGIFRRRGGRIPSRPGTLPAPMPSSPVFIEPPAPDLQ